MELPVADSIPVSVKEEIRDYSSILDDFFYKTGSDLALMIQIDEEGFLRISAGKGIFDIAGDALISRLDWLDFVTECRQIVVQNGRSTALFPDLFLNPKMKSSLLCPLETDGDDLLILILNSLSADHYGQQIIRKTEELADEVLEKPGKILHYGNNGQNRETQE